MLKRLYPAPPPASAPPLITPSSGRMAVPQGAETAFGRPAPSKASAGRRAEPSKEAGASTATSTGAPTGASTGGVSKDGASNRLPPPLDRKEGVGERDPWGGEREAEQRPLPAGDRFELTVPEGYQGGDDLTVELPDGRAVAVSIPEVLSPGDDFITLIPQ